MAAAGPGEQFPRCLKGYRDDDIDMSCFDHVQQMSLALMFLATEIPQLTQRGDREMSVHKVVKRSELSGQAIQEVFAFLTRVLQDLHRSISSADPIVPGAVLERGLLKQRDLSHQGNRHAERELRQLRAGLQQLQTMSRNLKSQIEHEVARAEGERSRVSLTEMNTANDAVLARLTAIWEQVNQRIHELSIPVPQQQLKRAIKYGSYFGGAALGAPVVAAPDVLVPLHDVESRYYFEGGYRSSKHYAPFFRHYASHIGGLDVSSAVSSAPSTDGSLDQYRCKGV